MKKLFTVMNVLVIVASAFTFFKGVYFSALMIAAYGMALGSMYGKQKKGFHIVTMILNGFFFIGGIITILAIVTGNTAISDTNLIILYSGGIFVLLVFTTFFNIKYAKQSISQISR